MGNQMQSLLNQLPAWVTTDRFEIKARAEGNPGKDDMRLMMQSLLADRFKLAIHKETRQVSVFNLVLVKPGKTGPRLQLHPADAHCSATTDSNPAAPGYKSTPEGGFPTVCGGVLGMPPSAPGRFHVGARNVTLALIANYMASNGNLGRGVVDQTGLTGRFDFALEWAPEIIRPMPTEPGRDLQIEPSGPTFVQAVRDQLGLKLEPQKSSVEVIVFDHIEHPSEN
jgi:uncharacterized protein (TIGR03435 family)